MALNEYQVIECPKCGARHKMLKPKSKIKSYEIYSDGKTISAELNEALEVTVCEECNFCYWIEDAEVVKAEVADELPAIKAPSIKQYAEMLEEHGITTDEEEILRMELLWAFNDRVRAGKALFEEEGDEALWSKNMDELFHLLDSTDMYSRLLKAEIHREKGEFEQAETILSKIKEAHLAPIKNRLLNAIKFKEKDVVKIEMQA